METSSQPSATSRLCVETGPSPYRIFCFSILVAILTTLAYLPAFPGSFLWDDDSALLENPLIHEPGGLRRIWFSTEPLEYHPITYTSLWLQWRLFGPQPTGYLAVNLALHIANAVLFMLVLMRLQGSGVRDQGSGVRGQESGARSQGSGVRRQGSRVRGQESEIVDLCLLTPGSRLPTPDPCLLPPASRLLPPVSALLFALHPVNVFAVAWINQHKTVLSTFFYLLSTLSFVRYLNNRPVHQPTPVVPSKEGTAEGSIPSPGGVAKPGWVAASLLLFIAGLLSKPTMVLLPLVFALIAALVGGRRGRELWMPIAPFLIAAGLAGLSRILWQPPPAYEFAPPRVEGLWTHLVVPGRAILFYLRGLIAPVNVMMVYPRWQLLPPRALDLAPSLAVLAGIGLLWKFRGKTPLPVIALAFFLLGLFPVLGFFDNQYFTFSFVASHWLYMPMMGIAALAAGVLSSRPERGPAFVVSAVRRVVFYPALILIPLLLLLQTRNEASRFRDPVAYYERGAVENPDNVIAQHNLANLYAAEGRADEALYHYLEAARIHPMLWQARIEAGRIFAAQGKTDRAVQQYSLVLETFPDNPIAHFQLGTLYGQLGNLEPAVRHLEAAVVINPFDPVAFNNLGIAYYQTENFEHAAACFEKALELNPAYETARANLARVRKQGSGVSGQ